MPCLTSFHLGELEPLPLLKHLFVSKSPQHVKVFLNGSFLLFWGDSIVPECYLLEKGHFGGNEGKE